MQNIFLFLGLGELLRNLGFQVVWNWNFTSKNGLKGDLFLCSKSILGVRASVVSGNISGNISTEINNRFPEIFPQGNFC